MRAFFMPELKDCTIGSEAPLPPREAEHLFRTLRARPGESVELLDGAGISAKAEVVGDGRVRILEKTPVPPPALAVRVYTALPRANILPSMLTALVEAGASAIIPMIFQRSVVRPEAPGERWRLRLEEGCKQSRNPYLPETGPVMTPEEMIAEAARLDAPGFFGDRDGAPPSAIGGGLSGTAALAIGPEGGFTPEEVEMMRRAGWQGISFSRYVMRLETAAVTGCAILRAVLA